MEKLEKLKKSLDNKFIPDNMKDKIRAEIKKLESEIKTDETMTATEVKEEVKEIEEKVEKALEVAEKKEEQAEAKVEEKKEKAPRKAREKKTSTSETKTPKVEPKATAKKKSVFSIAKEIRKDGESWEQAKERASKMMKSDTTETKKKVRTETDKLLAMVRRNKEYKKLAGSSDLPKDASRRALPRGKRVSQGGWKNQYGESEGGKVYYENRANRVDVGVFKNAYLEYGGGVDRERFNKFISSQINYIISLKTISQKREPIQNLINNMDDYSGEEIQKRITKDNLKYALQQKTVSKINEVLRISLNALKYADGGTIIGMPETPLARGLDIDYTTLVGETGAMSSGELFAGGGSVYTMPSFKVKFENPKYDFVTTMSPNITLEDAEDYYVGRYFNVGVYPKENMQKVVSVEYLGRKSYDYAQGGYAEKGVYVETLDEEIDLSEDGRVKAIKTQQGGNKSFGELREMHGASPEALAFAEGGGVWTKKQREQVAKLDDDFEKAVEKAGIERNSKEASVLWRNGGFRKRMRAIFEKEDENYAEGGSLGNHGLKQGDQIIKTMSCGVQKVKTKSGDIVYVNLANGYRGDVPPLPFDKGGRTRERKYVNYSQKHEVRYSKDKPHRRGYGYAEGGFMTDPTFGDFQNQVYAEKGAKVDNQFSYMMLSRLQMDCDYYLGYGNRSEKVLWAGNVDDHIAEMKKLWNSLPKNEKPEWLTMNDILDYEKKMKSDNYATGGVTKNYINRNQLNTITIKKGDQKLTYKVSDVYNGAYKLEDGGNLEKTAFYVSKRNIVKVQLKDGKDVKVANGYWIKKGAKPIHTSKYDDGGEIRHEDYDDVIDMWDKLSISQRKKILDSQEDLEEYGNHSEIAEDDWDELDDYVTDVLENHFKSKMYAGGGKTTFKEKATAIAKNFEGKKVEPKYQKEYGKTYDKAEAKEVGNKIAGSQKAKYDSKMSGGGSTTKRGGAMVLAKQIRKDGESWQSALKRANEQLKK